MNKQAFARVGAGMALMLVAASMLAPVASAQSLDAATATALDAALAGAHRSERKAEEREKYLAIGESDRRTPKFRKPAAK